MLSNINYRLTTIADTCPSPQHIALLEKMIQLINPKWTVDRTNKSLLELGIITIKDGYREERYPFLELVIFRIPPIIFSNNYKYVHAFIRNALYHTYPIDLLYSMTKGYYEKIKHQKLTF